MFLRFITLSVVAAALCGCAATQRDGSDYTALTQKVGAPKAGHGRIVVFREKAYGGIVDKGWDVQLDGQPLADLKTGTYIYADRPAGRHKLSATEPAFPGETQREVNVQAGRTYFFMAKRSKRAETITTGGVVAGLSGMLVTSVMTANDENPGPLDFVALDEQAARTVMSDIRLAE